jgi:hypothetical protein
MAVLCGCGHVVSTTLMCSVCNCPAFVLRYLVGRYLEESAHLLF